MPITKKEIMREDDVCFQYNFEQDGVYLSGPIRCVEDNGRTWRNKVIEDYEGDITFLNPLDNFDPAEYEILNNPADLDPNSEMEQILPSEYVPADKIQINQSEALFVGFTDNKARGTSMECMYAWMLGIPFFVWKVDGQEESGWVHEHCTFISDDRDEVMEEVIKCLKQ